MSIRSPLIASLALIFALTASEAFAWTSGIRDRPNIVVVLCDDLGYGDVQPLNPKSKIATPAFNQLAKQGITFTDAHSPSGVCTPTRYGLICGRYCWRTRLKQGVLGGYSKPLLEDDQQTIATVLRSGGYRTGCVGKWHLGLGWQWKSDLPDNINYFGIAGKPGSVDFVLPIDDGPQEHGFDYSYIIPASLDMSPYVYVENGKVTSIVTKTIDGRKFPAFYRKGEIAEDFEIIETLRHLTGKATDFIRRESKTDQPYFLYVPLPAPHKPVIPEPEFTGKSNLGPYGDFILQVDDSIQSIVDAIDSSGSAENTLLIVTSDNGSFMNRLKEDVEDHVDKKFIQGFRPENHLANGMLRGTKADIWEGGHRVPFLVRWNRRRAGETEAKTICLVDILATAAEVGQATYQRSKSPDSHSILPLIDGSRQFERPPIIHHSSGGMFAIREGKWKLVLGNGSGGRQKPKGKKFERPYFLANLTTDPSETENQIKTFPDIARTLERKFELIADGDQFAKPKNENN